MSMPFSRSPVALPLRHSAGLLHWMYAKARRLCSNGRAHAAHCPVEVQQSQTTDSSCLQRPGPLNDSLDSSRCSDHLSHCSQENVDVLGKASPCTSIETNLLSDAFDEQETQDSTNSSARSTHDHLPDLTVDTCCDQQPSWTVGQLVERLLDDISDIWVGAIVIGVHPDNLYDIEFADGRSIERDVEGQELRLRKVRLDMPADLWQRVGACFYDKRDLCNFDALGRAPHAAMQQAGELWWCTAYHEQFGRCCPRCSFDKVCSTVASTIATVTTCYASASLRLTPIDRMSWKTRFLEQERLNTPQLSYDGQRTSTPGDAAYTASGKKIAYGAWKSEIGASSGWYFDPRLGRMVRES